ncbi:MAG TPA: multidrug efflux SMR transporter [Stellaceae bacterium]|nr:multidrug efflux SMR transporter [Stellaceae bacterium]
MAWLYLGIASVFEVTWAFAMKQSQGFARLGWGAITIGTTIASFGFLALAMRSLPLGTAYTIWTGIGAVGTFALGVIVLGESASAMRLAAAGLIVSGLVLMRLSAVE